MPEVCAQSASAACRSSINDTLKRQVYTIPLGLFTAPPKTWRYQIANGRVSKAFQKPEVITRLVISRGWHCNYFIETQRQMAEDLRFLLTNKVFRFFSRRDLYNVSNICQRRMMVSCLLPLRLQPQALAQYPSRSPHGMLQLTRWSHNQNKPRWLKMGFILQPEKSPQTPTGVSSALGCTATRGEARPRCRLCSTCINGLLLLFGWSKQASVLQGIQFFAT